MKTETIQKYSKYSQPELIKKAQIVFNKFIRERDADKSCISCGSRVEQAGHFYSAGHYSMLRFHEYNCNGQCVRCNYYLSGNLNQYRINLEKRIGKDSLSTLDTLAVKRAFKWDRFTLIDIIEKYKELNKK